jgi:hypothetical protein
MVRLGACQGINLDGAVNDARPSNGRGGAVVLNVPVGDSKHATLSAGTVTTRRFARRYADQRQALAGDGVQRARPRCASRDAPRSRC